MSVTTADMLCMAQVLVCFPAESGMSSTDRDDSLPGEYPVAEGGELLIRGESVARVSDPPVW